MSGANLVNLELAAKAYHERILLDVAAAIRRLKANRTSSVVLCAAVARARSYRIPQIGEIETVHAGHFFEILGKAVVTQIGLAAFIRRGHDPPDAMHALFLPADWVAKD